MFVPDQPRQQAVFDRLRQGILRGTLPARSRLPPTRALAEELGVARQTVVMAYERLAAEGYVSARVGSGTYVAADLPDMAPEPASMPAGESPRLSRRGTSLAAIPIGAWPGPVSGPLAAGVPAPELFPTRAWARCTARVAQSLAGELAYYPDPQGLPSLRAEIAAHLAASRGLVTEPDRIIITSGTQQALRFAAELLLDPDATAWVEEPGYIAGRGALLAAGLRLVPIPCDTDGLDVAAGIRLAPTAGLALVAPSSATPLGGALPIGRRLALLDWAARADAWIVEDDCDSEFRWEGRPLAPLATLDRHGRVLYCGTFSKTLAPALRLGFVVVPPQLVAPFIRLRALSDRGTGAFGQAALAEFMRQGLLAPHIRRVRTEYSRRRTALLDALSLHGPTFQPQVTPGGLHLTLLMADECDERATVLAARKLGLSVAPLGAYFVGTPDMHGLVVGFASTPTTQSHVAVKTLQKAVVLF